MSSRSTFECFGLVIHGFGWKDVLGRIDDALAHGKQTWIVTANPEILLASKREPRYWQTIRQADLRLVDGFGLQAVGWLFQSSPKRLTGVDLAKRLLGVAETKGWKVGLVGGGSGIADKAAWNLRQAHSRLRFFAEPGGTIEESGSGDDASDEALQRLTMEAPDLLLVAFGHPKQEAWISRHLAELPSVKVAVGVGGTLDYWAGSKMRAPSLFRTLGLEWLWRLFSEPNRWKRIVDAVFVFPYAAIADRVTSRQ